MKSYLSIPAIMLLAACGSSSNDNVVTPDPTPDPPQPVTITADFSVDEQSWSAGFSDYPVADADIFELESGITALPSDANAQGFRLKGMNRSDDLFMFLKREVTGLQASQRYTLHGNFSFLSNAGEGCAGIGGAPGESVYVKMGASEIEPEQADYFLNLDKGNQSQSGNDSLVLGNVAAPDADCSLEQFGAKTIEIASTDGFDIQASTDGSLWIFIGTDSGFEGLTDLYYTEVNLTLTPES